jgi:hypothetical protein
MFLTSWDGYWRCPYVFDFVKAKSKQLYLSQKSNCIGSTIASKPMRGQARWATFGGLDQFTTQTNYYDFLYSDLPG